MAGVPKGEERGPAGITSIVRDTRINKCNTRQYRKSITNGDCENGGARKEVLWAVVVKGRKKGIEGTRHGGIKEERRHGEGEEKD